MGQNRFPAELFGGLWHSTSLERYHIILETGAILPNPDIPDPERWGAGNEPGHIPLVRFLGGVSLFDFTNFEPDVYRTRYPASRWQYFVPNQEKFKKTVWIEISRKCVSDQLISRSDLLQKWKDEKLHGHNFMPMIEAAHIGPIPASCFLEAYIFNKCDGQLAKITK